MVQRVVCLNGHDVTGVEGFTCPSCRAEVRTVLLPVLREPGPRPLRLMILGALVLSVVVGLVAARPGGPDPLVTILLFVMGATGSALWLAGCLRIAVAIVRAADAAGAAGGAGASAQ